MLTYVAGLVCIAGMLAASALVADQLWRERNRYWSTLLGRNLPPAASVTRPPSRRPQLRAVEAGVELTPKACSGVQHDGVPA